MADIKINELGSNKTLFFGELITDKFGMLVLPRNIHREKDHVYVYRVLNVRERPKKWKRKYR